MSILRKFLMIGTLLALGACTNATGFGGGGGGPGGVAGTGGAGFIAGTASDPSSPAFFQQTVGDRVLFVVDQSTLSDEARLTLQAQAEWMLSNPAFNVIIEGHADERGTREYNLALGARRANAAREFLVSRGVAGNRLRTVSYGKERPIALCSNESCFARNRRAVTVLSAGVMG